MFVAYKALLGLSTEDKTKTMAYNLREQSAKNYKQLEEVNLPRVQRAKAADPNALYHVKIDGFHPCALYHHRSQCLVDK